MLTEDGAVDFKTIAVFSCVHPTLHLAVLVGRLVGWSVGPSIRHIFEFQAIFALLLLPNHPRLDCRVSDLVHVGNNRKSRAV